MTAWSHYGWLWPLPPDYMSINTAFIWLAPTKFSLASCHWFCLVWTLPSHQVLLWSFTSSLLHATFLQNTNLTLVRWSSVLSMYTCLIPQPNFMWNLFFFFLTYPTPCSRPAHLNLLRACHFWLAVGHMGWTEQPSPNHVLSCRGSLYICQYQLDSKLMSFFFFIIPHSA